MNKTKQKLFSLVLASVAACTTFVAVTGCSQPVTHKDVYEISYDLNYSNAETRKVNVPYGGTAISWRANREGYCIEGWYKDEACTQAYDFAERISSDVTLYAKWEKEAEIHKVTFDGNYAAADVPKTVKVKHGEKIDPNSIPVMNKIGFKFIGWYKDGDTQKWDFENNTITDDITLKAKYEYDASVSRDENGKPIYENIKLNVFTAVDSDNAAILRGLANSFNREYNGKIEISTSNEISAQELVSLRFQQTAERNRTSGNYYAASDIFELAGIDYSQSDWYDDTIKDSYVRGKLHSVPVIASAPYIIYNKNLMTRYNGDNELPQSYNEFVSLLKKVYASESESNNEFKSIVCQRNWTFKEVTSLAPFMQNNAEYYRYENGHYVNDWKEQEGYSVATTAFDNFYSLFGKNGDCHGKLLPDTSENDSTTVGMVSSGNAFMGLINLASTSLSINRNVNLGVIPLGGLFSDNSETKDYTPVLSVGLSFYRASGLSNTELAATAVFADYVAKNSAAFAVNGWMPVSKEAWESDKITNPSGNSAALIEFIKTTAHPATFRNLDGHTNGKTITSSFAANKYIIPFLDGNGDDMQSYIDKFINNIVGELAK